MSERRLRALEALAEREAARRALELHRRADAKPRPRYRTTAVRAIFRALKLPVVGDEAPPHYTLHEIDPGDGRPIVFGFMVGEPAGGGPAETILQLDGTARTYESATERAWDHWLDSSRQEAAC